MAWNLRSLLLVCVGERSLPRSTYKGGVVPCQLPNTGPSLLTTVGQHRSRFLRCGFLGTETLHPPSCCILLIVSHLPEKGALNSAVATGRRDHQSSSSESVFHTIKRIVNNMVLGRENNSSHLCQNIIFWGFSDPQISKLSLHNQNAKVTDIVLGPRRRNNFMP